MGLIKFSIQICVGIIAFLLVFSQSSVIQDINPCMGKLTCRECIQTKGCVFCSQPDFGNQPRCFKPEFNSGNDQKCGEEYTINPDTVLTIRQQENLTTYLRGSGYKGGYSGSYEQGYYSKNTSYSGHYGSSYGSSSHYGGRHGEQVVQVTPQNIHLKLRLNQEVKFGISYSQAIDYPVDLYYLMDLSKSMEDDKQKLSILGDLLSATMRNITSNFRLGFGSFVDKVLMPYVSTVPKNLREPCSGCAAPYGFHNVMPLSMNTDQFSQEVNRSAVSGNLDAPEGGFDAIMQAIVCRQIGWREQARHLLVFSTDAGFHYAGDGKLGGVITPNDGQCHLDERGFYTYSTIQDYPSISQINQKVKNNSINIIFAVTQQQIDIYEKLVQFIEGSSCAVLSNDSSNVVDIIREEYSKISSSVEMKTNLVSENIKVKFYSKCLNNTLMPTNKCDGLKVGDVVTFEVEIVATSCAQNTTQTFKIYPVGLTEGTVITVDLICECECEKYGHFEINSPQCSGNGSLKCGVCECYPNYFGENCQCSQTNEGKNLHSNCRPPNTTVDCSGRGHCVCGQCQCTPRDNNEVVTGKYCECDNFSCERKNNLLCSGHGRCECGQCNCDDPWIGSDCGCLNSTENCIDPNPKDNNKTNALCSGFGTCVCNKCVCDVTDTDRHYGNYCQKCPTCSTKCKDYKDCVECLVYHTYDTYSSQDECLENCSLKFNLHETVDEVKIRDENTEYFCTFFDKDDCKYNFIYFENSTEIYYENGEKKPTIYVIAQKERKCPPKVFMLGIILGVIAAIVLVGLAVLLLWKLLTTIHDRREFARFEKERMMAKWDTGENPIYRQATSTFKNPTYGK